MTREREKTLTCFCPWCGARMSVTYDATGSQWERSTDLPWQCPRGHDLTTPVDLQDALHVMLDQRARDGVGDADPRDRCGWTEAQR